MISDMESKKMNNLEQELFQVYIDQDNPPVLELQNINHQPIGALYLKELRNKKYIMTETNNSERYYFYSGGIGIYFSFFKKLSA